MRGVLLTALAVALIASAGSSVSARSKAASRADLPGRDVYEAACSRCHGPDGRGIQAMNAPRLKGMSDWYLVTQLKNFRQGIRGAHELDTYGPQMALIAEMLRDDQVTNDLVAYIGSLK